MTIAVNLSPLQIRAPGAALGILNAIRDAGLPPHRLELEVTESLFIEDSEHTARFMEELAGHGVRFALDDFGTGLFLARLHQPVPVQEDQGRPQLRLRARTSARRATRSSARWPKWARRLEMEIVAEGLETIEQVDAVRNAGCTLGQGYYFSRAVPDFLAAMLLAQERDGPDGTRARRVRFLSGGPGHWGSTWPH